MNINKDNFITDDKTNCVFFSSLLAAKKIGFAEGEGVILRAKLREALHEIPYEELLNTRDVWARDYMPIQLTKDLFLDYTYSPDYLNDDDKKYRTNWQLHKVHTETRPEWDFQVLTIPLILDGGNVIKAIDKDGNPTIIMCDKVLRENNVSESEFRNWWNTFFENQINLILVKWEGKSVNSIGHADGMLRYIAPGKMLITNYSDYKDEDRLVKPLEPFFKDIVKLHYSDMEGIKGTETWESFKEKSWCYINFLQVGDHIILPSLASVELDSAAQSQIAQAFGPGYNVELIDHDMSRIVEDPKKDKNMNSGGALNCLTWTICI